MKCILNTIFVLITLSVFYISSTAKNVLVENRRVDTVTVKDMLYDGPDTVVALPRYEFRNDKRGHLLSRLIDSMTYNDKFYYFNLTRQNQDSWFLYLISAKNKTVELIDKYKGCYIGQATNEPVFISDFSNSELERIGLVPTSDIVYVKFSRGLVFPTEKEYRAGIRITALGQLKLYLTAWPYNTIMDSPGDWKHFEWLQEENFDDESPF